MHNNTHAYSIPAMDHIQTEVDQAENFSYETYFYIKCTTNFEAWHIINCYK